jgi:hypothetical protein
VEIFDVLIPYALHGDPGAIMALLGPVLLIGGSGILVVRAVRNRFRR